MRRAAVVLLLTLVPWGHGLQNLLPTGPPSAAVTAARPDGWTWPVRPARVVHAFDRPAEPWLAGHRGVDLDGRRGSTVRSAGAGTVVFAGSVAGVPVVTVQHADGLRTTYQPVEATVRRGQWVDGGRRIGTLGRVGGHCAPAACLHWGLLRGADYLDPLLLVTPTTVRLLPLANPVFGRSGT